MYEIPESEFVKGRRLKRAAFAAPLILTAVPAILTFILFFIAAGTPPAAAVILFFGIVATTLGFIGGLGFAAFFFHRHTKWTREIRERIAAGGIKAEEINWFWNELSAQEKRSLKAVEERDPLLADAFREMLASRLTATRIIKTSKKELLVAKKRQNKVKQLKTAKSEEFQEQIARDVEKISGIHEEAKLMLAETETRLQMIEAAATRGGSMADSELALKKLSARTSELPLALESAKMAEEIRLELEKQDISDGLPDDFEETELEKK